MIEANSKTPSVPVLRKLAKVLGVRTSALLGEAPSEAHEGPVNPRLAEVERALFTYRSLRLTDGAELPSLVELNEWINNGWDAWFTSPSRYSDVLRMSPELIVNSERAVHEHERSVDAFEDVFVRGPWVIPVWVASRALGWRSYVCWTSRSGRYLIVWLGWSGLVPVSFV